MFVKYIIYTNEKDNRGEISNGMIKCSFTCLYRHEKLLIYYDKELLII